MSKFWVNLARKIIKIPEFFVIISRKNYPNCIFEFGFVVSIVRGCTKSMYNTTPSQLS